MMARNNAKPHYDIAWLKDFLTTWAIGVGLVGALFSGVMYFAKNELVDFARGQLGVDKLATSVDIAELRADIHALGGKLDIYTGEDGVVVVGIRESYVIDPVYVGDSIKVKYMLRRTINGQGCVLVESIPLFKDGGDAAKAGKTISPPIKVGPVFDRYQVEFSIPEDVGPGRVELTVSLKYDCQGAARFDDIPALIFELLPKK